MTAAEIKYLFYRSLVAEEGSTLRELLHTARIFDRRIGMMRIARTHLKLYNRIHGTSYAFNTPHPTLPHAKSDLKKARKRLLKQVFKSP